MTIQDTPLSEFSGGSPVDNDMIKTLRSKHPLWNTFAPQWDFYLSAYEGGADFACEKNLFKHVREHVEDFNDRVTRLHNLNYCEPIVDFFTNFIFSESIDRDGGTATEFYKTFVKNVNRRGDNVDAFMRQVSDDSQIFGMSYILVDAPAKPVGQTIITKQDETIGNIRPYWVLIKPDEITDWSVDEFDRFQYIKRVQIIDNITTGGLQVLERYTEFYNDIIRVTDIDVTVKDKPVVVGSNEVVNELGRIPFVVGRYKRSKRYKHMGMSFLRDLAGNNREIMNLTSLLQEFLYRQAFNILAKEVDSGIPMVNQEEGTIGTANAIEVPKGAQMPKYISPPADPAKFIQDERGRIKNEMFVRASQDALSELFNGEKSSGFSQAQSFSKTVPFISSRADMLESVENELMTLTMEMMSKTWDGKIKYKDHYELTNITDALTQFMMLVRDLQLGSETFVKTELKRMVHEFDGKLPTEDLAKIEKEIDEINFEKWQKTQKEALVGKGQSPAAQQKPKSTGTMQEVAAESMKADNVGATKKLNNGSAA